MSESMGLVLSKSRDNNFGDALFSQLGFSVACPGNSARAMQALQQKMGFDATRTFADVGRAVRTQREREREKSAVPRTAAAALQQTWRGK